MGTCVPVTVQVQRQRLRKRRQSSSMLSGGAPPGDGAAVLCTVFPGDPAGSLGWHARRDWERGGCGGMATAWPRSNPGRSAHPPRERVLRRVAFQPRL